MKSFKQFLNESLIYTSCGNLNVGDVFAERPNSDTWFKVDKIVGANIFTTNIDDKSDKITFSKFDNYKIYIKK